MSLRLNLDQLHRARGAPLDARQVEMVRRMRTASEQLIEAVEALLAQIKRATRGPTAPAWRRDPGRLRVRRVLSRTGRRRAAWRARSRDRASAPPSTRSAIW